LWPGQRDAAIGERSCFGQLSLEKRKVRRVERSPEIGSRRAAVTGRYGEERKNEC
jgi:hypothetical protein